MLTFGLTMSTDWQRAVAYCLLMTCLSMKPISIMERYHGLRNRVSPTSPIRNTVTP